MALGVEEKSEQDVEINGHLELLSVRAIFGSFKFWILLNFLAVENDTILLNF
jgi:hypothetical protein